MSLEWSQCLYLTDVVRRENCRQTFLTNVDEASWKDFSFFFFFRKLNPTYIYKKDNISSPIELYPKNAFEKSMSFTIVRNEKRKKQHKIVLRQKKHLTQSNIHSWLKKKTLSKLGAELPSRVKGHLWRPVRSCLGVKARRAHHFRPAWHWAERMKRTQTGKGVKLSFFSEDTTDWKIQRTLSKQLLGLINKWVWKDGEMQDEHTKIGCISTY